MITTWKQWWRHRRLHWQWWRYRQFKRKLARHTERYSAVLPPHTELYETLKRLKSLPSVHYDYRLGQTVRMRVYYSDWGKWQSSAREVDIGVNKTGVINDVVTQRAIALRTMTLDDYLLGYQPITQTLDAFRDELVRDGLALLDTLRVAEDSVPDHRKFYYQTRASRLVTDLQTVTDRLSNIAMDHRYVK